MVLASHRTHLTVLVLFAAAHTCIGANAWPEEVVVSPTNAATIVVGKRKGKEVARWAGALDWQGTMPIEFIGERKGKEWSWKPHEPAELQIKADLDRRVGIKVVKWAHKHKATWVQIIVVPALDVPPGPQSDRTSTRANGDPPRAPDTDADAAPDPDADAAPDAEPAADADAAPDAEPAVDADADAAPDADTATESSTGLSDQGAGRGQHGDPDDSGTGSAQGRNGGYAAGSEDPSWYDNPRAELVTENAGRTPADGGTQGGSAGGEQGGDGNVHGLGLWGGLLDAPDAVAPLVSAGMILADASFVGFGQKFLSRVVRGMGVRALRKEIKKEAAQVVTREMAKVRDKLSRSQTYRSLPVRERDAILRRTEMAMTRAYYKKAQAHFTKAAERNAAQAATYRAGKDSLSRRFATLSAENEAAYREMAQAARESLEQYEAVAKAQERAARRAAKTAEKEADRAGRKLDKAKRNARARGPLKGKGGLRWISKSRVVFEGMEVRAVRDLAHMADDDLADMVAAGKAATDRNGAPLQLHHMDQNPNGPVIEIAQGRHSVHNPNQHPKGNVKGDGLSPDARREFNAWRQRYWKARARDELARRESRP